MSEDDELLVKLVRPPPTRGPARLVVDIALLVSLTGIAIPFGLHETSDYTANAYEWGLAAFAMVAVIGIAVDLIRVQDSPWPLLIATFTWASQAAYAAMLPNAVTAARISLALLFAGWAVLSAGAWRLSVLKAKGRV